MIRTINFPTGVKALPPSVRARLENPPDPGTGVHTWLYSTTLAMLNFISADECVDLLHDYIPRPPKPRDEIELQVEAALQTKDGGQVGSLKRRPEFPIDLEAPRAVLERATAGKGTECLRDLSPVKEPENITSVEALTRLCPPGNPLICAGQYFSQPFTAPLSEFHPRFLSRCSFVVPNPMSALKGLTDQGRESARSANNVGPRRWAVIEADIKPNNKNWAPIIIEAQERGLSVQDLGAALLLAVSEQSRIPLTAVVHSGSVSLHGWFFAGNMDYDQQEWFYRIGARWGGDPATWSLIQWVRMPSGVRWEEDLDRSHPATLIGPQRIEYFDFNYET